MNKKRLDDFTKIRYGYRVVLIVILLIVSIILLKLCQGMLTDNENESNRVFENYYHGVERKIGGFEKVSEALFENDDVKSFAKSLKENYNAYKVVPIGKLIGLFESIFNEGEYRIVLTNLENKLCACNGGSTEFKDVRDDLLLTDEAIETIKNSETEETLFIYDEKSKMISFVFSRRYNENIGKLYCFIVADVNLLLPYENFVVLEKRDSITGKTKNMGFIKTGNTFFEESLFVPGLIYKYTVKYNDTLLFALLIVCTMVCVIFMLYNRKISEKILNITYMPLIKATRLIGSKETVHEIENWDKSALELIYNSELLQSSLMENKEFRKKTYLRNLLYGMEDCHEKHLKEYDLKWLNSQCRVILIDFINKNSYTIMRELLSISEFEPTLKKQLCQSINGELIAINETRYAYITNCCNEDELKKSLVKVLGFAENFDMEAFVYVGDEIDEVGDINISFRSAMDCIERKSAFALHSIIFSREINNTETGFYYPIDLEISLVDNTLAGNKDGMEEILSKLLNKNLNEMSLDEEKMHELKIVMVSTINRIINMMNENMNDIFGENLLSYMKMGTSHDREEFEKNIKKIFRIMCEYNENSSVSKQDRLALDIMDFIKTNFSDPEMSLEKIARTFYISQNHVSRVLKSKIGKSYKEYLNDVRINEAKRLLKTTPIKVVYIANDVGYTDIGAFNRMFKKYTKHTPEEYRLVKKDKHL